MKRPKYKALYEKAVRQYNELAEAIEQAQKQEPVALKVHRGELCYKSQDDDQSFGMWCPIAQDNLPFTDGTKFYTSPPQRQPLTDEQIEDDSPWKWGWYLDSFKAGVRYAEAAHGIKGEA